MASLPPLTDADLSRFASRVAKQPTGCWLWSGHKGSNGYGAFDHNRGGKRRTLGAHRIAYFIAYGQQPGDLLVCHHCDVPLCVNPEHLFLGTNLDNMRDAASKGRFLGPPAHTRFKKGEMHVQLGESHPRAKLNEEAVREILASPKGCKRLARQFGVNHRAIRDVRTGRCWSHVTGILQSAPSSRIAPASAQVPA